MLMKMLLIAPLRGICVVLALHVQIMMVIIPILPGKYITIMVTEIFVQRIVHVPMVKGIVTITTTA